MLCPIVSWRSTCAVSDLSPGDNLCFPEDLAGKKKPNFTTRICGDRGTTFLSSFVLDFFPYFGLFNVEDNYATVLRLASLVLSEAPKNTPGFNGHNPMGGPWKMREATMAQIAAIMRDETLTPALKQRFTQVSHCFVHASSLMLFDLG